MTVIGTLRTENELGVVRMEETYSTSTTDLWAAMTEPKRLVRWIAEVDGDLRLGGLFHATFTSGWAGTVRVDECVPEAHLLMTSGVGEPDATVIEATLTPDGDRTRLVIEERGFALNEVAAHGAGWHAHVEDLSSYFVGGTSTSWHERWSQLAPRYRLLSQDL